MPYPYTGYYATPYATPQMPTVPQMPYGQPNTQPMMNNGVQPQMPPPQATPQPMPSKTNVPLVTSLTEAMSRNAELNTDYFYADQDKPFIYRVSVDMQGRKTYRTFELTDVTEQEITQVSQVATPTIDLSAYATKDDLRVLKEEITNFTKSYMNNRPATSTNTEPKRVENTPYQDKSKSNRQGDVNNGKPTV